MKFEPKKYLMLMEEEWLTFDTIDTLYNWVLEHTLLWGTEIQLCFMIADEVLSNYMFTKSVDTTGRVLTYCERILWGE